MKFGIRECANLVFRAKTSTKLGNSTFSKGQPVLYIDTATTSSLEQATTTVYAQGGRGNVRLISWEGDKTVTFTVEDALLSPVGFSILSGAGLFKATTEFVHFHMSSMADMVVKSNTATIDLSDAISEYAAAKICVDDAPLYVMKVEDDGSITGELYKGEAEVDTAGKKITLSNMTFDAGTAVTDGSYNVMVDYYIDLPGKQVYEADITASTFGGSYYVEADTLFRDQATGKDLPANLTFPNVKIQSNFTITMAGTGDPSAFTFTMDAFPDYTYFDRTKKVMCVLQVMDGSLVDNANKDEKPVMPHTDVVEQAFEFDSATNKLKKD